jgi:hypothetical protein
MINALPFCPLVNGPAVGFSVTHGSCDSTALYVYRMLLLVSSIKKSALVDANDKKNRRKCKNKQVHWRNIMGGLWSVNGP